MNQPRSGSSAALKSAVVVMAGILLGWSAFYLAGNWPALAAKLQGNGQDCPWTVVLSTNRHNQVYSRTAEAYQAGLAVERADPALGIVLVRSRLRNFWIKEGQGTDWSGERLLAHLETEHAFLGETNSADMVRPGDVVMDCGAHIGVFTFFALQRGASRVVAVEPDPVNLECFRRNFAPELASGRVALVEKGVWNRAGKLTLSESTLNSGSNTFVGLAGGRSVEVAVTTIDNLVEDLHLPRVDYIKFDIEGSERQALSGARVTLGKFRPRLMLDAYHRPDDPVALPQVIREAHRGYRETCGPCDLDKGRLIPHAIFFRP